MTLLRGLLHRAGVSVAILVVAVVAVAAAAIGPSYAAAARASILRDSLVAAPVIGRDLNMSAYGDAAQVTPTLRREAVIAVAAAAGSPALAHRLFAPPVTTTSAVVTDRHSHQQLSLVARAGVCAHLRFETGRCATRVGEVTVSRLFAQGFGIRLGAAVPTEAGQLRVVGIYSEPNTESPFWLGQGSTLFPQGIVCSVPAQCGQGYDAVFSPLGTFTRLPATDQARSTLDQLVAVPRIRPQDVTTLGRIATAVLISDQLNEQLVNVQTQIPSTVTGVRHAWSTMSVPILVITLEVLVLVWALLFVILKAADEARGAEIALAKLRGYGRWRTLVFGLAEPAAVLLAAFPLGALIGWLVTHLIAGQLLRPGTQVPFPATAWLAAAAATAGGLAALAAGVRGTLIRPVIEQWRRTVRHANRRSWVLDAAVAVAAIAGLVDLATSGALTSASHDPMVLLVPGLLGVAVAVAASRLLPAAARLAFGPTRRGGRLAGFLAVRHIARRTAATRTMAILAVATSLAVFSVASWNVGERNRQMVADVSVGAPAVINVATVPVPRLTAAVDRVDPAGNTVAAVVQASGGGPVTLAVQPDRFARVAAWNSAGLATPASTLGRLDVPAPPPITVTGGKLRISVHAVHISPAGSTLTLDVVTAGGSAPTPVVVGALRAGRTMTRVVELPASQAQVIGLDIAAPPLQSSPPRSVSGRIELTGLEQRVSGRWQPVVTALAPGHWRSTDETGRATDAGQGGLAWSFASPPRADATLAVADRPARLPAVVAARLTLAGAPVTGLDGQTLPVTSVAQARSVPGAPDTGIVVNLRDADRAGAGILSAAQEQVWTTGDGTATARDLNREGLHVLGVTTSTAVRNRYTRAGPGLASILFVVDAAAAAVLAALATVMGIVTVARRRRYEYAALATSGLRRSTLFGALAGEQAAVIAAGIIAGTVAGIIAIVLVLGDVPEFVRPPLAVTLSHRPSIAVMAGVVVAGLVALLAVASLAAWRLLGSIGAERLREGPA